MKHFSYEIILEKLLKKYRNSIFVFLISLAVLILIFILGLCLVTYENQKTIIPIFAVIVLLFTILSTYILVAFTFPYKRDIKQMYSILGGYLHIYSGEIQDIKNIFTTVIGRKGLEIILKCDDKLISVVYDPIFGENPFKIGQNVTFKTSELFIIYYEVINE